MKKIIILLIALIVLSLIISSCGKLLYKTEGAGDNMYLEKTTVEKIIKVTDESFSNLHQITFKNSSGKMTFYLGMPAKDTILEYCDFNKDYKEVAQQKINFFEHAQPEDEPYLLNEDGTMQILFNNGEICWIRYFPLKNESNLEFKMLNGITNRSSVNDIVKILGNPQKIDKPYSEDLEFRYKIFKDKTTSLNLFFHFEDDSMINFIMSYMEID